MWADSGPPMSKVAKRMNGWISFSDLGPIQHFGTQTDLLIYSVFIISWMFTLYSS